MTGAGRMAREEYLRRWSALHGGVDPTANRLVGLWLGLTYWVAQPLVRVRLSPNAVTGLGLLVALAVPGLVALDLVLLAAVVTVLSGLLDNLDGAVAVITQRASAWGALLDALADRFADAAYLVAFWLVGAPGWLCLSGAALMLTQEYARARAALPETGVVTVAERPTRVIVTALFLLGAGLYGAAATTWATAGAAAWTVLGAIGCGQLLLDLRRRLR